MFKIFKTSKITVGGADIPGAIGTNIKLTANQTGGNAGTDTVPLDRAFSEKESRSILDKTDAIKELHQADKMNKLLGEPTQAAAGADGALGKVDQGATYAGLSPVGKNAHDYYIAIYNKVIDWRAQVLDRSQMLIEAGMSVEEAKKKTADEYRTVVSNEIKTLKSTHPISDFMHTVESEIRLRGHP